jgi:L-aminopeptidase/D-esterase-like protein
MGAILDIKGISVGHYTDYQYNTGCTVILCANGAIAGVDIRGTALGTHEIDLVRTGQLVKRINAVLLVGGSAFGLQAVQGVMRYLEEHKQGFKMQDFIVPIVTAASIFDLEVAQARPDNNAGYQACKAASDDYVEEGAVGVGTGALVGKFFGPEHASKGGVGTASRDLNSHSIGMLVVVNCLGCVIDADTQQVVAGPRYPSTGQLVCDTNEILSHIAEPRSWANNLIAVIATDLPMTKEECNELACVAHNGFTRVVRPADPSFDTSIVFVLSTASEKAGKLSRTLPGRLDSVAAELVAEATIRAVTIANASAT